MINTGYAKLTSVLARAFATKSFFCPKKESYKSLLRQSKSLLNASSDPVTDLRDFHEQHLLRVVELYKHKTTEPHVIAGQLAELRKALAVQSFRMAAENVGVDLALLAGGSMVKGDHTFLTDVDLIVVPALDADSEAAKQVSRLMSDILEKIGLEGDDVMPRVFNHGSLDSISVRMRLLPKQEYTSDFYRAMCLSNGSFFRFLMDINVLDVVGRTRKNAFLRKIESYRTAMIYEQPEAMIELCKEQFDEDLKKSESRAALRKEKQGIYDSVMQARQAEFSIKNDTLRLFYYALYALRAKHHISHPSPWEAMEAAAVMKIVDEETKESVLGSVSYMLGIRHLICLASSDARDSYFLTEPVIRSLMKAKNMSRQTLFAELEDHRKNIQDISRAILSEIS